jgi:hypothetical protein
MSRSSNLGDIDIRGLELVSMKPRANGKKTRERTPATVGVVGKTAKHKRDTFEIDWTDECTQQGKNSARPKFLTWDQIGKRVGPKALQGREIVIEDEDEKEVMARIHGRQSDGPNAKYDVTVAGTTKKIAMTWALIGEALAKRREMDVRMVALGQSGRLENMTCTPCMPVYNSKGDTPEEKGNTRYLGVYISFADDWREQRQRSNESNAAFFKNIAASQCYGSKNGFDIS